MSERNNENCYLIRDLMPSYVDGLTSEDTNQIVENHLQGCEDCRKLYEMMKEPSIDMAEQNKEKIEIHFLKKNQKKTRMTIGITVLIALFLMLLGIRLSPYLEERELSYEEMNMELRVGDVTIENQLVEDGILYLTLKPFGHAGVRRVSFSEENGVVDVHVFSSKEGLFSEATNTSIYHMDHSIKQIRMGNVVLWDQGVTIPEDVIKVYQTRHLYVGNAPENGETETALHVFDVLGEYKMELQTKSEPYGMTLHLEKELEAEKFAYYEKCMRYYAYASIAVIDNLSSMTFTYTGGDGVGEKTWSLEEGQQELGKNLKEYGESEAALYELQMELGMLP